MAQAGRVGGFMDMDMGMLIDGIGWRQNLARGWLDLAASFPGSHTLYCYRNASRLIGEAHSMRAKLGGWRMVKMERIAPPPPPQLGDRTGDAAPHAA